MSSSTTTVRQTTTVTSSGSSPVVALSVNTTFLTSIGGILTLLELVLGIIVFSLCYQYAAGAHSGIFLLLISFAYWLVSLYILLSAFLSASGTLLPNTFFYFLFHVFGAFLSAAGGIAVLAQLSRYSHSGTIAAGAMGLIAAICHVVHVAFIYKGPKL
uniref:Putative conserved plasma membrane protein n=1 Tax=Amblyomma aureolatum TaxID=187763 RepID=A0A1E1WZD1_9ACAR